MITRITIKTDPPSRTYKDRLTITRFSVRYEYEPFMPTEANPAKKWTVSSKDATFTGMFRNLCEEVEQILALPERPIDRNATITTFMIMCEDGNREERALTESDEIYTICFTIIDQMVKYANRQPQVQPRKKD